ncbi:MAG: hydrogenase formation protein HypD [Candidatus Latescibacteria bacterium]|nr:hydrogenase formation protein HypD [Candidatus Latescibacterota bacterium]NIO27212.1 hydrogenase formation protein HypD [Candidatus Latescibacterota bacterium]NIO54736.1 hydrogenase formation protein HypD [Candidatus Latescibacterota bacterium]NIT00819.1 hydrogenase formation protein HypD [Candidatus Latescibacterota bacterium]NIT37742.1 hydrogenase formation protein HypD [Candidatus Latescibacterota bacterium]
MKYVDEYRDEAAARKFAHAIALITTKPWTIMEICGGQTHTIVKFGIDELLPPSITLVHGPGCPVCVTPLELIEKAIEIASIPEVIFCSFGDMLRVPGADTDLLGIKSKGGDVRIVYSPLDAVRLAEENPDRKVVFFAVGFETTAPANAMAVYIAHQKGIDNFSLLVSHVLVPPAIEAILASPKNRVQAFLAAGHVCTVMGYTEYEPIALRYNVPIVVTAFEPLDILQGLYMAVKQLEEGRAEVENQYTRSVRREGNREAQRIIQEIFEVRPRKWRGVGEIPRSGFGLKRRYAKYDAELQFDLTRRDIEEPQECHSGLVLQGVLKPNQCPAFGNRCTPEHPLGATMVSSEGACAAYYRYRSRQSERKSTTGGSSDFNSNPDEKSNSGGDVA